MTDARLEIIMHLQSRMEDPHVLRRSRDDARQHLSDMFPPITQCEWDDARHLADAKRAQHNKQNAADRRPARPEHSARVEYVPPETSYAGGYPSPGEDAYIVQGEDAAARVRAMLIEIDERVGMRESTAA